MRVLAVAYKQQKMLVALLCDVCSDIDDHALTEKWGPSHSA